MFVVEDVSIGVALEEHVINFVELVMNKLREIEVGTKPMVVGINGSEFLNLGDPGNSLYFGNNNLLFLDDGGRGRLGFGGEADDELVFIDFEFIE